MNFRVFLLIAAMAVFGGLWSSDSRYQADQIALARLERARSSDVAIAVFVGRRTKPPTNKQVTEFVASAAREAQAVARVWAALWLRANLPLETTRPVRSPTVDRIEPNTLLGRLVVMWTLGLDPGNGVSVLSDQATLAKARLEERFCLVRFRTRQAAYFASRRVSAFLRAQLSAAQQPGRIARIIIREVPIEESRVPAAGGRQTR